MRVGNKSHASAAHPRECPVTLCMRDLVGSRAGLDGCRRNIVWGDNIKMDLETLHVMDCAELAHGRDKWRDHAGRF